MDKYKDQIIPGIIKSVDDYIYCFGHRQLKAYIEKTVKEVTIKLDLEDSLKEDLEQNIISELENKFLTN